MSSTIRQRFSVVFAGILLATSITALAKPSDSAGKGKVPILVDELGDFTETDSESGGWAMNAGLPDTTALTRRKNAPQFLVYRQPHVTDFSVTVYCTPASAKYINDGVDVFVSPDGSNWVPVETKKGDLGEIPEVQWNAWKQNTVRNLKKLPPASNYLKFELPPVKGADGADMADSEAWRVQLGRIELFADLPKKEVTHVMPAARGGIQAGASAQPGRQELRLTGPGWKVWLDQDAQWKSDKLYLPDRADPALLPENLPTGGWQALDSNGVNCTIPASIEEIFSGGVNSYQYHGVSWFWKEALIPADWAGKRVSLHIDKARMRTEVYVNGKLAGYDLVSETPLDFDLTSYLDYGKPNRIAIRLTNPGGSRGWEDAPEGGNPQNALKWGKYDLPMSHDFSGIGGEVTLTARDPIFIENLFVKNLQPAGARNAEIHVTVRNTTGTDRKVTLTAAIEEPKGSQLLLKTSWEVLAKANSDTTSVHAISVPGAKLWSVETPNLYKCHVSMEAQGIHDETSATIGFRVFEVVGENFYLNGKRVRIRSSIDWGFYALTGFNATPEMARLSVENAKAIGHNGINFHRQIGEPLVMDVADELGLFLYEEPGAFHDYAQMNYRVIDGTFAGKLMEEKCRRMFLRDRNHPSLMMFCLANESNTWGPLRERVMRMAAELDGSRLVTNTSGSNVFGGGDIWHIRPYETEIRKDYWDDHTVEAKSRFQESDLFAHKDVVPDHVQFFGEVRCYTGPDNSTEISAMKNRLPDGRPGYDLNVFAPMSAQIESYFNECHVASIGSRNIKTPSDVSRQAGRGLMYIDGRLGQGLMRNDSADGYAINGWSGGCYLPGVWSSAICDEGRNLKGPAADFAYWTRDLQIAIARKNGKYFQPGQTAEFDLSLINEGKLPAGDYVLKVSVRDGAGKETGFTSSLPVKVAGGERYAQPLGDLKVPIDPTWRGGYLTIQGELQDASGRHVANGTEQVLLQNRPSFAGELKGLTGAAVNWPAASKALSEAGVKLEENPETAKKLDFIAAGDPPESGLDKILERVKNEGTLLLIRFDAKWADLLLQKGILSEAVTEWGGEQTDGWGGNGWGYLDHFVGDQAIPGGKTIGTTSWEAPGDPKGFAPFKSTYKRGAYGAYLARPSVLRVLIGTLDYGKGKIILSSAYPVDDNNPFSDLLFFNMIFMGSRGDW